MKHHTWLVLAAFTVLILTASFLPQTAFEMAGGPLQALAGIPWLPAPDLIIHAAGYAVVAGLLAWALRSRPVRQMLLIAIVAPTVIGVLIEVLQPILTESHNGTVPDAIANAIGAVLGTAAALATRLLQEHRKPGSNSSDIGSDPNAS